MKTLVNIIDPEHPVAAYLFIQEMFEPGDRLLFIAANDDFEHITPLVGLLQSFLPHHDGEKAFSANDVERIVLRRDADKYTYERICRTINSKLDPQTDYYVNLAGGSRYMALSVQHVFSNYKSIFFYIQTHENLIVKTIFDNSIYDDDDVINPIRYKMSLAEYFEAYGLSNDLDQPKDLISDEAKAKQMFDLFANHRLSNADYKVLDILREKYRGLNYINIFDVENNIDGRLTPIPNLSKFLNYIKFDPAEEGLLDREELDYLTGGWFEEYVYYLVKAVLQPDDIAIGVHIDGCTEIKHNNELDVVFIRNNQLFVIECKSGIKTDSMFNEIVYKVCALKEVLLGIDCHSYIFSLKKDPTGDLKKVAQYMNINFLDYDCLTHPEKLKKEFGKMMKIARG